MSISDLAQRVYNSKTAFDTAEKRVVEAQAMCRKAEEERDSLERRYENLRAEAARSVIEAWLFDKLHGKSVRERQAIADELGALAVTRWSPMYGGAGDELERQEALQRLGLEVFGEHISAFCDAAQPTKDEQEQCAYSLMAKFLVTVLHRNFLAVAQVWRAEPKSCERWDKRAERESAWRAANQKTPPRFLVQEVYTFLNQSGRIKPGGPEWTRISGCAWSFRNAATVESDICKAVSGATLFGAIEKALPQAA